MKVLKARSFLCLSLTALLVSCSSSKTTVKENTFEKGKMEVSTVELPEPHMADVIVAILPFKNNSPDKSLDSTGAILSELISAQMSTYKGFKIVERQRLEEVLGELKLAQTGIIDQSTAIQIGKMLGANVMALGSFSKLGKKVLVTMRLVKVETGEIVGGVTERGEDISNLDILAENAAKKLSNSLTQR